MSGAIANKEYAGSTSAIDVDFVPTPSTLSPPFKVIDVVLIWDSAPTTSENVVVGSITPGGSNAIVEYEWDAAADGDTTQGIRLDKDFMRGTTITVDYTNTDANSVEVVIRYRELEGA